MVVGCFDGVFAESYPILCVYCVSVAVSGGRVREMRCDGLSETLTLR